MLLQAMGNYQLPDCEFVVYKQQHISETYIGIPDSLRVRFINIPSIGSGMRRILFEQTLFYKYLEPCDVLYSYCTSMPLFTHCKKIFTLHDVYYLTTKQRYGWAQRTWLKYITKIYCKKCDTILTVSQYSKNEIVKYLNIPPRKLVLTYNFVLPTSSHPEFPNNIMDIHGKKIDLQKKFYLYIGNLQPGKNIKGMIDGFAQYAVDRDDVQLIIAGKPTTDGEIILKQINNIPNIHYIGYQSRENIDSLLAHCNATVLLSFCEGFGIPPIEGFQYGKPTLAANTTSLPEDVGSAGVLVDPYDTAAISHGYLELEENYTQYAAKTTEQLNKFSATQSVETFISALSIKNFTKNKSL